MDRQRKRSRSTRSNEYGTRPTSSIHYLNRCKIICYIIANFSSISLRALLNFFYSRLATNFKVHSLQMAVCKEICLHLKFLPRLSKTAPWIIFWRSLHLLRKSTRKLRKSFCTACRKLPLKNRDNPHSLFHSLLRLVLRSLWQFIQLQLQLLMLVNWLWTSRPLPEAKWFNNNTKLKNNCPSFQIHSR